MLNEVAKASFQKHYDILKCKQNAAAIVLSDIEGEFGGTATITKTAQKIYKSQLETYKSEFESAIVKLQNTIVKNSTLIV